MREIAHENWRQDYRRYSDIPCTFHGGVQSVNNVRPDDTGNINITNIDNANHANTADMFSKTGNELGVLLWNMFHRYGVITFHQIHQTMDGTV